MNMEFNISMPKPVLQIEARLSPQCSTPYLQMRERIHYFLTSTKASLVSFQLVSGIAEAQDDLVRTFVEQIWVAERSGSLSPSPLLENDSSQTFSTGAEPVPSPTTSPVDTQICEINSVDLSIHVYQLNDEGATEEFDYDRSGHDEPAMMAHHWVLPCREFEGIWDNLIFDDQVQIKLLEYVYTTFLFSDKNVNPDLVSWNRVVLLHGPPGTGKTSLCKGLAQKLSVRLSGRYRHGKLLEINSHSLFSKWFSESGKMVQKLFNEIWTMVEDPDVFVCLLIDEVESLAAARKAALSGTEPSDSIRVVNALLTQIDRLKQKRNVLILTTSNITEAIDIAFVDRADIKMHIGLPSANAIYSMFIASLDELQRAGIIQPNVALMDYRTLQLHQQFSTNGSGASPSSDSETASTHLFRIAQAAAGLSGRSIRRLPFLAHAGFVQAPVAHMMAYLYGLHQAVQQEQHTRQQFTQQ
ncbi:Pachytene checkpoint protein 2 [Podila horticola]|nr:Pachytene checkpoint protein 2 [Podila horticola]